MLPEIINSLDSSYQLFSSLQTKKTKDSLPPPRFAENADFDSSFAGMFINKPIYKNCRFNNSIFERPAGESSKFYFCSLNDCKIYNGDFRYCDFENTTFISREDKCLIKNSNFSYGTFVNTNFISTEIFGTPFREMIVDSCLFKNCELNSFGFERTTIKNSTFENIDMSRIVFRFCNFINVKFNNVTIHILDLAKNFGLIKELVSQGENIKIFYGENNFIGLEEAIDWLPNLIPYYLNEKEYYYVINILMINDRFQEIWGILPEAFEYVINRKDFATLQDLCGLVVNLDIFDKSKLNQLYNIIRLKATPNDLSNHQLKSYSTYLENIKNILLNDTQNNSNAIISFYTNVEPYNIKKIAPLLTLVEQNILNLQPDITPQIQISHHSPYIVEVLLSGLLPDILSVCQMFYYAFGGIKSLKDIMSSRREKAIYKNSNQNKLNKQRKQKQLSLSIGKINFQYFEECEDIVESVEYTVT